MPTFVDTVASFTETDSGLLVKRTQDISSDFLASLHCEREYKRHNRLADFHKVASVPTQVVDVWLCQGRDVWNATPRQIVQWLERDSLQAFIATPKSV